MLLILSRIIDSFSVQLTLLLIFFQRYSYWFMCKNKNMNEKNNKRFSLFHVKEDFFLQYKING